MLPGQLIDQKKITRKIFYNWNVHTRFIMKFRHWHWFLILSITSRWLVFNFIHHLQVSAFTFKCCNSDLCNSAPLSAATSLIGLLASVLVLWWCIHWRGSGGPLKRKQQFCSALTRSSSDSPRYSQIHSVIWSLLKIMSTNMKVWFCLKSLINSC